MKMCVLFKSGTTLKFDVDEYKVEHSRVTGEIAGLQWTTPASAKSRPNYFNVSDISAVYREG